MQARRRDDRVIAWHSFDTPLGRVFAASTSRGVCRSTWHVRGAPDFLRDLERRFPGFRFVRDEHGLTEIARQLREYLTAQRRSFSLPVDLSALSEFERSVLEEARRVPFGATASYSELARQIGRPGSARAVGNALRRNPVAILVPCHRIVRADGSPGGYGGPNGTPEKVRLLQLEAAASAPR